MAPRLPCMDEPEDKSRAGDVEAWVAIAVIDAVATAVVCGLYFWLRSGTS